jgi:hypothetical protein
MRQIPHGKKSVPLAVRFDEIGLERIEALGKRWGGVLPLPQSDVVRVALDRAFEAEFEARKKSDKKTRSPVDL